MSNHLRCTLGAAIAAIVAGTLSWAYFGLRVGIWLNPDPFRDAMALLSMVPVVVGFPVLVWDLARPHVRIHVGG